MFGLLQEALPIETLVVAIDPGKISNRIWLASGDRGLVAEPVSLPTLSEGVDKLERLVGGSGVAGQPSIAIEATGSLHRAWTAELERRFPGCVRLLAPSETQAARAQLGARRFKTDDRDCAALVWLARQGLGRRPDEPVLEGLLGSVRHRRALVGELKVLRQRLHDQLNVLCPGLSAPARHGRALDLLRPSGHAVLSCAVAFGGRAPSARSLIARAPGRLTRASAEYWAARWRACLPPPADAELRVERLRFDLERLELLTAAFAATDAQSERLLAETAGQVLTTLPASRPPGRRPSPATRFRSSASRPPSGSTRRPAWRRPATSRRASPVAAASLGKGWPTTGDALMAMAWGLSQHSPAFRQRAREYTGRGFAPIQARVALARHACRLCHALLRTQQHYDEERYCQARSRGR